jgi:predicted nucleic acid-binding protein
MRAFVDAGFLLTLLFETDGSKTAWEIVRGFEQALVISNLQVFVTENRLRRQIENDGSTAEEKAIASAALQRLKWYLDEQVFQPLAVDYEIAIRLAMQWQRGRGGNAPALLLLWPALAATAGMRKFLSFDPRTRRLAKAAGLELLPEAL